MCRGLIIKKNGGCPLLRRSVLSVLIFSWLFVFFLNPLIFINRSSSSSENPWSFVVYGDERNGLTWTSLQKKFNW